MGLINLPNELLLLILNLLDVRDIVILQLVSKRFHALCLDDTLWKVRCFEESTFLVALRRYRQLHRDANNIPQSELPQDRHRNDMANWDPCFPTERISWYDEYRQRNAKISLGWLQQPKDLAATSVDIDIDVRGVALYSPDGQPSAAAAAAASPSSGYSRDESSVATRPLMAVSPLDDGSICLWDLAGSHAQRGSIIARSKSDILFIDGPGQQNSQRSKRVDAGVTECVAVDNHMNRAFFAVQSHLIEVDLHNLRVVNYESFPWSITTLSTAQPGAPLTVGTSHGLHMYDYRTAAQQRPSHDQAADSDRLDGHSFTPPNPFRIIFDDKPLHPYVPLAQPTPLSILHLPQHGHSIGDAMPSDDIYVAGRFSSILHYDRRYMPRVVDSIFSGARLSALTSLPHAPFSPDESLQRRRGNMSIPEMSRIKNEFGSTTDDNDDGSASLSRGWTLIACGEYGSKGSLEMYGLHTRQVSLPRQSFPSSPFMSYAPTPTCSYPPAPRSTQNTSDTASSSSLSTVVRMNSAMQNRQTSSGSKLLSIATHGTRIICSDSSGDIKWFERDGFTEVRRHHIGHAGSSSTAHDPAAAAAAAAETPQHHNSSLFSALPSAASDDLARKVVPMPVLQPTTVPDQQDGATSRKSNSIGDVLFWTGERLGLMAFSRRDAIDESSWTKSRNQRTKPGNKEDGQHGEEEEEEEEEQRERYDDMMRRALERQADEVRFMRNLGMGSTVHHG